MGALALHRIAPVILILVLFGMGAHSVWVLSQNRQSLATVQRASELSDAYHYAQTAMARAEMEGIRFAASGENRAVFDAALINATAALLHISEIGDEEDRDLITHLFSTYAAQIQRTQLLFDSIERGEAQDDTFGEGIVEQISILLNERNAARQAEATESLAAFEESQDRQTLIALSVFGIGLPLVAVLVLSIPAASARTLAPRPRSTACTAPPIRTALPASATTAPSRSCCVPASMPPGWMAAS
jgi:hypothetical protein